MNERTRYFFQACVMIVLVIRMNPRTIPTSALTTWLFGIIYRNTFSETIYCPCSGV